MASEESDGKLQHVDQSLPHEWRAVDLDGQTLIIWDRPEDTAEVFAVSAVTHNHRTLAKADAALLNGCIVHPTYLHGLRLVEYYHAYAGKMDSASVAEWSEQPMVRLKQLPAADVEGLVA